MLKRTIAILSFFLALAAAPRTQAEFPPDTFPDDSPAPASKQRGGSYEEEQRRQAEEDYLAPKKRRGRARTRLRPRPTVSRVRIEDDSAEDLGQIQNRILVGGLIGLSQFSSSNPALETDLENIFLKDNFLLGAFADFSFSHYFGADLDFFYALTPTQEIQFAGGELETRQLSQMNLMGGARVGYPIVQGKNIYRASIGAGFGILSIGQALAIATGSGKRDINMMGPYASAGLEAQFGSSVTVYADYSMSLSAFGSFSASGAGDDTVTELDGASFTRIRVGGHIRVYQSLAFGPQLSIRTMDANLSTRPNLLIGQGDSLFQLLGVLSAEL